MYLKILIKIKEPEAHVYLNIFDIFEFRLFFQFSQNDLGETQIEVL